MSSFDRLAASQKESDVDALMKTAPKHYVRRDIWLPRIAARQQQLQRPIKYFTLTTAELLDVKLLERAGLIEKTERGYPGIGFCEMRDKIYADIIRNLRWCTLSHKGTFEEMTKQPATFDERFEFDVVNLDFIMVPFQDQEAPLESTWGAIRKVLEVQYQKHMSFDLFLTFRGSREGTNDEAVQQVAKLIDDNLQSGRGVKQFEERIGHTDPMRLLDEDYVTFLCMGLPKLLIGDAIDLGFEISRTEVFSYPRQHEDGEYRIVKFVLSLEVPSGSKRRFAAPPSVVTDYETAVVRVFQERALDVEELLDDNPRLKQGLEKDLLSLVSPA